MSDKIITADIMLAALASKHSQEVFVPECKDGPTQSVSNYLRLDAWVMNKSWSNPKMTGYEIKVSRSDFLNDNKWHQYLPLCNEFYFAAPKGLIQLAELPASVGLIELLGKSRLVTRRKAVYREIEFPSLLVTYVLMCRTEITGEYREHNQTEHWKRILADKVERDQIGLLVAGAIKDHVAKVTHENSELKSKYHDYDTVRRCLSAMGIDSEEYFSTWNIQQKIQAAKSIFPPELMEAISELVHRLNNVKEQIEKLPHSP